MPGEDLFELHEAYGKHSWVATTEEGSGRQPRLGRCACGAAAMWVEMDGYWQRLTRQNVELLGRFYGVNRMKRLGKGVRYPNE